MQLISIVLAVLATLTFGLASPIEVSAVTAISKRQSFTGIATVYYQGGAYGSCGKINTDASMVAAVSPSFGSNALCGRRIRLTNTGPTTDNSIGGKGITIEVVVADTCVGCEQGHLDLSVAAWNALTGNAYPSQVGISWSLI